MGGYGTAVAVTAADSAAVLMMLIMMMILMLMFISLFFVSSMMMKMTMMMVMMMKKTMMWYIRICRLIWDVWILVAAAETAFAPTDNNIRNAHVLQCNAHVKHM